MIWINVLQTVICAFLRAHGVMTMETLSMWWKCDADAKTVSIGWISRIADVPIS